LEAVDKHLKGLERWISDVTRPELDKPPLACGETGFGKETIAARYIGDAPYVLTSLGACKWLTPDKAVTWSGGLLVLTRAFVAGHSHMFVKYMTGDDKHNIVIPPTWDGELCGNTRVAYVGTGQRPRPTLLCDRFFKRWWNMPKFQLPVKGSEHPLLEDQRLRAGLFQHFLLHQSADDGRMS